MSRFFRNLMAGSLMLAATVAMAAEPRTMSLQVRTGELRDSPTFLSSVVASLKYGDRVKVYEQQGAWMKASTLDGGAVGWIHSSSLTTKKVTLQAGEDVQQSASSGELALAGKGFNSSVEADFKKHNQNLDFSAVDRMEAIKISSQEIAAFLRTGGLGTARGGAK